MFVLMLATAMSVCMHVICVDGRENKQGAVDKWDRCLPDGWSLTRVVSRFHIQTGYCNCFWEVVQCFESTNLARPWQLQQWNRGYLHEALCCAYGIKIFLSPRPPHGGKCWRCGTHPARSRCLCLWLKFVNNFKENSQNENIVMCFSTFYGAL
jgi:hypothetical protein